MRPQDRPPGIPNMHTRQCLTLCIWLEVLSTHNPELGCLMLQGEGIIAVNANVSFSLSAAAILEWGPGDLKSCPLAGGMSAVIVQLTW